MPSSDIFARAVELLAASAPPRSEVEAALRACEAASKTARVELERLAGERPALLVSGSDASLEELDASVGKVSRERDRADAIADRLRDALAAMAAAAVVAEREARRAEVEKAYEAAMKALRIRYTKARSEILAVLKLVATAQAAVADFAKAYPAEPPIADPEMAVRAPPTAPDVLLGEATVWRWAYRESGALLPDMFSFGVSEKHSRRRVAGGEALLAEIVAGTYAGDPNGPFVSGGSGPYDVVPRPFLRREIRRQRRRESPFPLAAMLRLPGLTSDEPSFDLRGCNTDPSSVLAALSKIESTSAADQSEVVVEFIPVPSTGTKAA